MARTATDPRRVWVLGATLADARAHRDADGTLAGASLTSARAISGAVGAIVDRFVTTEAFDALVVREEARGLWPTARRARRIMERNAARGRR